MENSINNDMVNQFFEAQNLNKKRLKENNDDICALIPIAGGARAIASSCKKILSTPRQLSIYDTCVEMLGEDKVYVNKMHNVVALVDNIQEAGAVMQRVYEMFGVKSTITITYEGQGKVYFAPSTPVDVAKAIEWEEDHNCESLQLNNPKLYLTGGH